MNKQKTLFLLLILIFIFNKNGYGDSKIPTVELQPIIDLFSNATSINVFELSMLSFCIGSVYDLVLSKRLVGSSIACDNVNSMLQRVKDKPVIMFLTAQLTAVSYGLAYAAIPALINFFLENIYSVFFENNLWKSAVINYTTLMSSAYMVTVFEIYIYPNIVGNLLSSTDSIIFIFMFQNYGAIAVITNLSLIYFIIFWRIKFIGW